MVGRQEGVWAAGREGEGVERHKQPVAEESRGGNAQVGDVVSDVITAVRSTRWVLGLLGALHELHKHPTTVLCA